MRKQIFVNSIIKKCKEQDTIRETLHTQEERERNRSSLENFEEAVTSFLRTRFVLRVKKLDRNEEKQRDGSETR